MRHIDLVRGKGLRRALKFLFLPMVHMLVSTLGLVSGIWAHGEVQLSDTAVELQLVRYANDRIITAYEGMPPSDFVDELQILQRRLGSSLEDLPELWIPATKLSSCLTSYARELEVDLIPSLADVSQEERIARR